MMRHKRGEEVTTDNFYGHSNVYRVKDTRTRLIELTKWKTVTPDLATNTPPSALS